MKKKTMSWASEESVVIYDGERALYTSPAFVNNVEREYETCLEKTPNLRYRISLRDSRKDSWSSGAWVDIRGKYLNTFFKSFMKESEEENYELSLYYGIDKMSVWKYSASYSDGWTSTTFTDSAWTDYTYDANSTTTVVGTQYYRKNFDGLLSMASYECRLRYMYGIVVYMNGNEVFRDNMDAGEVTQNTPSTGIKNPMDYRGFMRSGGDISSAQSVLAVELHFPNAQSANTWTFDAWLAILSPSFTEEVCAVFPYDMEVTGSGTNPTKAFNWHKGDYMTLSSITTNSYLQYSIGNGLVIPAVNGIRYFPYTYHTKGPSAFEVTGSNSVNGPWESLLSVSNWVLESKKYKQEMSYVANVFYPNYRIHFLEAISTPMYIVEMQLLVCNNQPPSEITFEKEAFEFLAVVDSISIAPIRPGFIQCTIEPALPPGLSLDAASCTVTGVARAAMNATSYTMTSHLPTANVTGSFSLAFTICSGTMIEILRTYKSSASYEGFIVTSSESGEVLYSVEPNSGQVSSKDWSVRLCAPPGRVHIEVSATSNYWYSKSYLYLYSVYYNTEKEEIARIRFDRQLGLDSSYTFNPHYCLLSRSEWFMKFGEVPASWTDSTTSGWTSGVPIDSTSSSHIQLFKKSFSVSSLDNAASLVMSLRYRHGCIVYLNGHEVFRRGVSGDLSTESLSSNTFSSLLYRVVSVPFVTSMDTDGDSTTYVQVGTNWIAVAIVGAATSNTDVEFDAMLRLTGSNSESRLLTVTTSSSNAGTSGNAVDLYYSTYLSSTSCNSNYVEITFPDDRREWINSVLVQSYYSQLNYLVRNFVVRAKNPEMEDYVVLATVQNITWSIIGQSRKIWIGNDRSFNKYRFDNFTTGDPDSCSWRVSRLDLLANSMVEPIQPLTYESTDVYKNIEMSELYPSSTYYTNFRVSPALPDGLVIDSFEGIISGTATALQDRKTYTISALNVRGGEVTTTLELGVTECYNGRSLITVAIRADSNRIENSYKLYKGRGTTGSLVASVDRFPATSTWLYLDRCLPDGLYTFEASDSRGNGWSTSTGFMVTVDQGNFPVFMAMVPPGDAPVKVPVTFSSFLPFQRSTGLWRVLATASPAADWMARAFDDSAWKEIPANELGSIEPVTAYIRKSFTLEAVEEYNVLNVIARFNGGLQAYFNGHLVARFNLPDTVTPSTMGLAKRSADAWSKFHVVLRHSGVVEGSNVMAFELHRATGMDAMATLTFDATGVFGVEECSVVTDSWLVQGGSLVDAANYAQLFDLNPSEVNKIENKEGSYLDFYSENQIGSRFSEYGFYINSDVNSYSFSLYAYPIDSALDEEVSKQDLEEISLTTDASLSGRSFNGYQAPLAILGFRHFRFEVDDPASSAPYIVSFLFRVCMSRGTLCPAVDGFPAVAEGEMSPSECEYGYSGYAYRLCQNGTLSEVHTDRCVPKVPDYLTYTKERFIFYRDLPSSTGKPSFENLIDTFYLKEGDELPEGLQLNNRTGEIEGTPRSIVRQSVVTVIGENTKGVTETSVAFMVRLGECQPDGLFMRTTAGTTAVIDCALKGSYVGKQERLCKLGENGGEWQKASGVCMPVALIVVLAVLAVVVVLVVIAFVVRVTSGKKSQKKSLAHSKPAVDI